MTLPSSGPDLASLSSLDDPVRRRLYDVVSQHTEPVGRDEAAAAAGIGRALAVYHLDKLVESGLLTASYQRPAGRSGPGAGRPAKLYTRSGREFAVTVPPREYELAARLLVQVVESDPSGRSRAALLDAARQLGRELGRRFRSGGQESPEALEGSRALKNAPDLGSPVDLQAAPDLGSPVDLQAAPDLGSPRHPGRARNLEGALSAHGYEPRRGGDGVIRLRNCPFHQLAEHHRDVVCGMNLGLIEGMVAGLGVEGMRPVLDPRPRHCCVAIGGVQP